MWVVAVVLVVAVLLVVVAVVAFNRLRRADIRAQEALGGIDVQLTRRADLVPNLVSTVRGYAAHEASVFEQVTAARADAQRATAGPSVGDRAAADAALGAAIGRISAVAEAYPQLQASTNFLDLQRQLADTEQQLAFARQYYNDAVATLNEQVSTLPWLWFAGMAGVGRRQFYAAPADVATGGPPSVTF